MVQHQHIAFRCPPKIKAEIDKRVKASGQSVAEIVREMLRDYLGLPEEPMPRGLAAVSKRRLRQIIDEREANR